MSTEEGPVAATPERKRIEVIVMGGPQDGARKTIAVLAGTRPRTVKFDNAEHRLIPGKHRPGSEPDAPQIDVTLAVHPMAIRLYAEPA